MWFPPSGIGYQNCNRSVTLKITDDPDRDANFSQIGWNKEIYDWWDDSPDGRNAIDAEDTKGS